MRFATPLIFPTTCEGVVKEMGREHGDPGPSVGLRPPPPHEWGGVSFPRLEAVFQFDQFGASLPQSGLLGFVQRRLWWVDAAGALEEPARWAGVGGGEGKVRQVVGRALRAARDEAGGESDDVRRLVHQLRANQARVKRIGSNVPPLASSRQLEREHQARGLRGSERVKAVEAIA